MAFVLPILRFLECGALLLLMPLALANTDGKGREDWMTFNDCQLVPDPANDGDSFHVRVKDKEYIFRLYLVDSPETDAADPQRLIEQGKHFGMTVPQVIELGEMAKSFVRNKLAEPFTVVTRMANAMGRSKTERFYAFVQTKDGDLGEQLVVHGLARIHGRSAKPPGISTSAEESEKLRQLENEAKQHKLGGWAANITRSNTPVVSPPATSSAPPSASVVPDRAVGPETRKTSFGKLDINTATEKELKDIPDIGPVIAARIIAARPFRSADDLRKVDGIGPKKYEKVRPYFN
jgi:DNA uptake protein ComE-like DNA-binding protein